MLENMRKLELREAAGAYESTPNRCSWSPFGHRTLREQHKCAGCQNKLHDRECLRSSACATREFRSEGIVAMVSDRISQIFLFHKKYTISLASREDWETSTAYLFSNVDIWYIDRSKKGELAGAGVYRCRRNNILLDGYITITQAELTGKLAAA